MVLPERQKNGQEHSGRQQVTVNRAPDISPLNETYLQMVQKVMFTPAEQGHSVKPFNITKICAMNHTQPQTRGSTRYAASNEGFLVPLLPLLVLAVGK